MTHIRVSEEVRGAINRLKRDGESVDDYLQRKLGEDVELKEGTITQSWLLDALDLLRKQVSETRYYPEPSSDSVKMEGYYNLRREQHAKDMQDSLAQSNRAMEKKLAGEDEP
jgi:hypothetical protein